ncbi:MAG TPA: NUDIX domain-containing protein, partial [Candidatus Lokiarchaeia archaeon]|nr:NUDIX domain-containing protein [Candidatus Lokiarchaeia archaeon]
MAIRAVKAIIRDEDKFLILKKSDLVDIYPGQWDLPGGRLEEGETWDEGLAREVWEETALEVLCVCEVRDWESQKWD